MACAQTVLCEKGTGCGMCDACRRFASGNHPGLVHLHPGLKLDKDEAPGTIKIAHIRRLVLTRAEAAPVSGGSVVILIEEADRMTWDAANSLLKVLEEPPPWMRFVLTTRHPESLPATVVSRCTHLHLGVVPADEIAAALVSTHGMAPEEARQAAERSAGLPGHAVRMAEDEQARERAALLTELFEHLESAGPLEALALAEKLLRAAAGGEEGRADRLAQAECLAKLASWLLDAAEHRERGEHARPRVPDATASSRELAKRGYAASSYQLDALFSEFALLLRRAPLIPHEPRS
jgi:DNA polymerase-3 subunit delta'